eukprot:m.86863 g.86863  ORF g.86863 m.86863 type:complete len:108 (-) comp26010_c0_seq2:487-810(-)
MGWGKSCEPRLEFERDEASPMLFGRSRNLPMSFTLNEKAAEISASDLRGLRFIIFCQYCRYVCGYICIAFESVCQSSKLLVDRCLMETRKRKNPRHINTNMYTKNKN